MFTVLLELFFGKCAGYQVFQKLYVKGGMPTFQVAASGIVYTFLHDRQQGLEKTVFTHSWSSVGEKSR